MIFNADRTCFNSLFSNSSLCILVSGCRCSCERLFALCLTALPRSSDWSNCADLLPAEAMVAKLGESFSLPAALNPVNGEMPASLNDATIFSGANANCQASLFSAGTSSGDDLASTYCTSKSFLYPLFQDSKTTEV